jgi:hypothetical protein
MGREKRDGDQDQTRRNHELGWNGGHGLFLGEMCGGELAYITLHHTLAQSRCLR